MAFNIEEFSSMIGALGGLAKSNRFDINISFPGVGSKVFNNAKNIAQDIGTIKVLAKTVALPGMNFTTTEIRRHGNGPQTFYPTGVAYQELPITFHVDDHGKIVDFLHSWFNSVMWTGTMPGGSVQQAGNGDKTLPFELNYKNEYAAMMEIITYGEDNKPRLIYTLDGVVPISIADTALDHGSEEHMEISTTFRYDTFRIADFVASKRNIVIDSIFYETTRKMSPYTPTNNDDNYLDEYGGSAF